MKLAACAPPQYIKTSEVYEAVRNTKGPISACVLRDDCADHCANITQALGQTLDQASTNMSTVALLKLSSYTAVMLNELSVNKLSVTTGSQLLLGDCLEALKTLPDESVDLLLTDPPYGINYVSRSHTLPLTKIANDGQEAYDLLDQVLAIAYQKLKPDRHVFIFTNFQAYEYMAPIVRKYFKQKGALVWVKNNGTRGDLKGSFSRWHEDIIHACKGRAIFPGKREKDVLFFDKVPSNRMTHPTEKPVPLLKYLIEKSTLPGEVVLDPFGGSGSTAVAAKETGRGFIYIDSEPVWATVAGERLKLAVTNHQS